jgi:hypothetical protein
MESLYLDTFSRRSFDCRILFSAFYAFCYVQNYGESILLLYSLVNELTDN